MNLGMFVKTAQHARVVELADTHDSKSCSIQECGFKSHLGHGMGGPAYLVRYDSAIAGGHGGTTRGMGEVEHALGATQRLIIGG